MFEQELIKWYKAIKKEDLNLENPITYNEKIQWLKINYAIPLKTKLSDKYLVRNWVKDRIGDEYLVNLLGVYNNFDEIDFKSLPNKFVLKCNHASGYNVIVTDKNKLDKADAKSKLDRWINTDYSTKGYELHYQPIQRKIVAEEYIEPSLSNHEIQIYCFNGIIKFFTIESTKDSENLERSTFYPDFSLTDFQISPNHYKPLKSYYSKHAIKLALDLANKLVLKEPVLRIDFIEYKDTVKFRELTFTSGSGLSVFEPKEYAKIIGDMIKLPEFAYNFNTKELYRWK